MLSAVTQKDPDSKVRDAYEVDAGVWQDVAVPPTTTTRERQQRRVPFGAELRTMWQKSGTSCGDSPATVTLVVGFWQHVA